MTKTTHIMAKLFFKKSLKNGQIAIGLAFAFTAVLAMFGLVFNSSAITRDKIKLQQTTDIAALVAAEVQRRSLDRIIEINNAIDLMYVTTLDLLNRSICYEIMFSATDPNNALAVALKAQLYTLKGPYQGCTDGCEAYESERRDRIIKEYERATNLAALEILELLLNTNARAFQKSLAIFLSKGNLPFRLQAKLANQYGSNLSLNFLLQKYHSGQLNDSLTIGDGNQSLPLFFPYQEQRPFIYFKNLYVNSEPNFATAFCNGPVRTMPIVVLVPGKIARANNYTTSYLASAQYIPPPSTLLFLKDPRKRTEDSAYLEDITGKKISLFQSHLAMSSAALAKPYGGSFPIAGSPINPMGSPGKLFKGTKLIGIADKKELQNFDLKLQGVLEGKDIVGKTTQSYEYFTEDFLH